MKKLLPIGILLLFISCRHQTPKEINNNSRIQDVAWDGNIAIYNVDGHEYLSRTQGGFIHLESCQCKKPK